MDGASLRALLASFAKPYKVFNRDDELTCHKLCAVAWHHQVEKAKDLVRRAADMPELYSYGSDGTPMLTRSTISSKWLDGSTTLRRPGRAVEFNLERAFLKAASASAIVSETTALFKPPSHPWTRARAVGKSSPRRASFPHVEAARPPGHQHIALLF